MSLSIDAIYNLINSNPLPIPVHLLRRKGKPPFLICPNPKSPEFTLCPKDKDTDARATKDGFFLVKLCSEAFTEHVPASSI